MAMNNGSSGGFSMVLKMKEVGLPDHENVQFRNFTQEYKQE
jgi:hypothetical protein